MGVGQQNKQLEIHLEWKKTQRQLYIPGWSNIWEWLLRNKKFIGGYKHEGKHGGIWMM